MTGGTRGLVAARLAWAAALVGGCATIVAASPDGWSRGGPARTAARVLLVCVSGVGLAMFVGKARPLAGEPRVLQRAARVCVAALLLLTLWIPTVRDPASGVARPMVVLVVLLIATDGLLRRSSAASLVATTVALGLLAFEAATRLLIALGVSSLAINSTADTNLVHWHQPGHSFLWTGQEGFPKEFVVAGRWNRWGFNDREPPELRDDTPVVFVVGDSYVEALQVGADKAFYRVTEEALARVRVPVRIVGLGRSGGGARSAAQLLRTYGEALRPRVVVYAFCYNDVRDDYEPWRRATLEEEGLAQRFIPSGGQLMGVRYLAFRGRLLLTSLRLGHRDAYGLSAEALTFAPDGFRDTSGAWRTFLSEVHEMVSWTRARGARFVLLELVPGSEEYFRWACDELLRGGVACERDLPRNRLSADSATAGYEIASSAAPVAAAVRAGSQLVFKHDGHYNPLGHRIVGTALAESLAPFLRADDSPRPAASEASPSPGTSIN